MAEPMLRQLIAKIAGQSWLRKAVMSTPGIRDLAWRFVAGENLDAGIAALQALKRSRYQGDAEFHRHPCQG